VRKAVLYLRSSKDRNDVSIDAQRRQLTEFAARHSLAIVGELADVVLSGKDENRPAFQTLLRELGDRARAWSVILALDTSRVARNQYIAHKLRHDCRKAGVDLIFAATPALDGYAGIMLPAVLHAVDEGHSYMSKVKGLAGMAENVRQGWRAGGRAPFGYELEHVDTGTIREGRPVLKSRLRPTADAPAIAAYLKGRAANRAGSALARSLGLELSRASLVGVEWNALTYAGFTVWNVHQERRSDGGYVGGQRRRPRGEWTVSPAPTHEALITREEAEQLLARLERGRSRYATRATYLFGGLMVAPDGAPWWGNRRGEDLYYRTGRLAVKAEHAELELLGRVAADLQGEEFARVLTSRIHADAADRSSDRRLKALRQRIAELDRKIERLTGLVSETSSPRPLLAKLEALEAERAPALEQAAQVARAVEAGAEALRVRPGDVAAFLGGLAARLGELPREDLKDFLRGLLERVVLDPATLEGRIEYAIRAPGSGVFVASPRGTDENPGGGVWRATSRVLIIREKRGRRAA
jgi:site-specific DNA recombinase